MRCLPGAKFGVFARLSVFAAVFCTILPVDCWADENPPEIFVSPTYARSAWYAPIDTGIHNSTLDSSTSGALDIFVYEPGDSYHFRRMKMRPPHWEISTGVDATLQGGITYATVTFAPFGLITEDGVRLRSTSGQGLYLYESLRSDGFNEAPVTFAGLVTISELLVGYQMRYGPLISKAFAGLTWSFQQVIPHDVENETLGDAIGVKFALENWLNIGEHGWFSLDGTYATPYSQYWVRAQAGWRFVDWLALGAEVGALGNDRYFEARVGGHVRTWFWFGELTASAGLSGDVDESSIYASASYLLRY